MLAIRFLAIVLFAFLFIAGGDSMNIVVNRLMLEGYTTEQIEEMKAYPEWPTYDDKTGLLVDGPQKFISPDYRLAVVYHVRTFKDGQRITREVKYDHSAKK